MVVIRLSRTGANKRPFYHVVVTDRRNARDSGRFIERIGYFNPAAKGSEIRLMFEKDRVDYWTAKGAQPSERVSHLLKEFTKNPVEPQAAKTIAVEVNKTKSAKTAKKSADEE